MIKPTRPSPRTVEPAMPGTARNALPKASPPSACHPTTHRLRSRITLVDLDDHDVLSLWGLTGEAERMPQAHVGKSGSAQTEDPAGF